MVFSSYLFLFAFLPLFLTCYLLAPKSIKNYILIAFSLFFYAWGAIAVIPFLIVSIGIDYWLSQKIVQQEDQSNRKKLFILGIILNVSFLLYYKYLVFLVEQINQILGLGFNVPDIALPIGVSFFTFQKISYLCDVFNKTVEPAKKLSHYCLYVTMFPQLIAGPIVRYHSINEQIVNRQHTAEKFFNGLIRFTIGLFKKVFIADMLGMTVETVFAQPAASLDAYAAWAGLIAYSLQLYFDFSGYSDMAVGLGLMAGFKLPENFNRPYLATSFTEFWRKWHMTLSAWMKEYLYIPLGGNRKSKVRTYLNLWIVFLLSGFWHGASWNFVLWGAFHGAFLVWDKVFWGKVNKDKFKIFFILFNFFLISLGWVLFRSENLNEAFNFYLALFGMSEGSFVYYPAQIFNNRGIFCLVLACLIAFCPFKVSTYLTSKQNLFKLFFAGVLILILFYLSVSFLTAASFSPFLYFKF